MSAPKPSLELGTMKVERARLTHESSPSAGTGVLAPEQPRLLRREIQSTAVGGFRHIHTQGSDKGDIYRLAYIGMKPDKLKQ